MLHSIDKHSGEPIHYSGDDQKTESHVKTNEICALHFTHPNAKNIEELNTHFEHKMCE